MDILKSFKEDFSSIKDFKPLINPCNECIIKSCCSKECHDKWVYKCKVRTVEYQSSISLYNLRELLRAEVFHVIIEENTSKRFSRFSKEFQNGFREKND